MPLFPLTDAQREAIEREVGHHPVSPTGVAAIDEIRGAAATLLAAIAGNVPPGNERRVAVDRVTEGLMWAVRGVAHHGGIVDALTESQPDTSITVPSPAWDGTVEGAHRVITWIDDHGGTGTWDEPRIKVRVPGSTGPADDLVLYGGDALVIDDDGTWVVTTATDTELTRPVDESPTLVWPFVWRGGNVGALAGWLRAHGVGLDARPLPHRPGRRPEADITAPPPSGYPRPYVVATVTAGQGVRVVDGRVQLSELDDDGAPVLDDQGLPVFAAQEG